MVLVLGVSAGARGARAILSHSDEPDGIPLDYCEVRRRPGASRGAPVAEAIHHIRRAAAARGELVTAAAVTYRGEACLDEIRSAVAPFGRELARIAREPLAQLRYLRYIGRLPESGAVLLYDLGATGLSLTLADCATGNILRTSRSTVISGDAHDHLVQRHLARAGHVVEIDQCRTWRETLSSRRAVTAQASTGDRITLTRNDLSDALAGSVHHSAALVRHLADEANRTDVHVLVLGGCARNDQLAQWLADKLAYPVELAPEPELVSARGALLVAGERRPRVVRVAHAIGAPVRQPRRRKLAIALGAAAAAAVLVIGLLVAAWTDDPATQPTQVVGVPNAQFE